MGKPQKFNYVADVFKVFKVWRNLLKQVKDGEGDKEGELLKVCEKLYKKWPKYAASRNVEALIWKTIWQGKVSEKPEAAIPSAVEYYRNLIDLVKDQRIKAELYIHLGDLHHLDSKACADAKKAFEKSLALSPDFSVAHQRLGLVHADLRHDLKALYHLASSMCCPSPCKYSKHQFRSVLKKYDPTRAKADKDDRAADKDTDNTKEEVPSPSKQSTQASNMSDAGTDVPPAQQSVFSAALLKCLSLLGRKGQFPAAKTALTNLLLPKSKQHKADRVRVGCEEMAEAVYLCIYILTTHKGLAKRHAALVLGVCVSVVAKEVKQGRYASVATGVLAFFGHHEAEKDAMLKAGRYHHQLLDNLTAHLAHHLQQQVEAPARGRRTPTTLSAWTDTPAFTSVGSVSFNPKLAPEQRDITVFASCFPFIRLSWHARRDQYVLQPATANKEAQVHPAPASAPSSAPESPVEITPALKSTSSSSRLKEEGRSVRVSIQEPEIIEENTATPSQPQAHFNIANDRDVAEWRFRVLELTCGAQITKHVREKNFRERSANAGRGEGRDGKEGARDKPTRASSQRSRKERREEERRDNTQKEAPTPTTGPGSATTSGNPAGLGTATPSQERSRRDRRDKRRGASAPSGTVSSRSAHEAGPTPSPSSGPAQGRSEEELMGSKKRGGYIAATPGHPGTPVTPVTKSPIELPPPASACERGAAPPSGGVAGRDADAAPSRGFGDSFNYSSALSARPLAFPDDDEDEVRPAADATGARHPSPSPFRPLDASAMYCRRFAPVEDAAEVAPRARRFQAVSEEDDMFDQASIQMSRRKAGRRYADDDEQCDTAAPSMRPRAFSQTDMKRTVGTVRPEETSTTEDEDVPHTPRRKTPGHSVQSPSDSPSDDNMTTDDEAESEGDDEEESEVSTDSESDILMARPYDLVSEHGTFRGALSENGDVLSDDDMLSQGVLSACFSFADYAQNKAPRTCSIASFDDYMAPPREAPSPTTLGHDQDLDGMFDDVPSGPRGDFSPFRPPKCAVEYEMYTSSGPCLNKENLTNHNNNLGMGSPAVPSRSMPVDFALQNISHHARAPDHGTQ